MQDYELMVIMSPLLTEEACRGLINKYETLLKDNGAQIVFSNFWGLRSLAYPIQKKTTGSYWVLEYQAPSDINHKLKIQILRDETIMRHLITKLDKYAVAYNLKKRRATEQTPEPIAEV